MSHYDSDSSEEINDSHHFPGGYRDEEIRSSYYSDSAEKANEHFHREYYQEDIPSSFAREEEAFKSPPKQQKTKGNAADATTLRISERMTITQLQQECKHRGIKGYSGKTKDWLLSELEVGSIWQYHRQEFANARTSKPTVKSGRKKISQTQRVVGKPKTKSVKPCTPGVKHTNAVDPPSVSVSYHSYNYQFPSAATASTAAKPQKKKSTKCARRSPDYTKLPRITSKLTISQLSYELMFRQPGLKGMSSKPKTWFLSLLGENSVWMTSPDVTMDLTNAPRVSKDLTVKQLTREITARLPAIRGLSSKSKEELVKIAADGSIFMTYNLG